ncbi:Tad domain-containing protein [Arthrobacter sp. Leaf69]|uniref:Tad domain-containing protein n=1 Tax=Arthrobacter sp. Leaf69 TaxID=1736232 RepID=UPI000A483541|nr:Tad domain-containing protein [Arthrobacter sp. Leaf69]
MTPADGERGAISVMVAILMVTLLGFTALAVDAGMLYAERTQLRNGADSAALAIAQKCARNIDDADCSTTSALARGLANSNAGDGASNIADLALDKASGTVKVTAGAQEAGKEPNHVSLFFARAMGFNDAAVTAGATVQWGRPVAGPTAFPIAFSVCQVKFHVDGGMQLLVSHGSKTETSCNYGPSGAAVPGGFGWLTRTSGTCAGIVNASAWAPSDPGNSYPDVCDDQLRAWAADITAGKDVTVLLPIFDLVDGTGSSTKYKLTSFAAFKVKGWSFNGNTFPRTFHNKPPYVPPALACDGSCTGVIGSFIRYVSLDNAFTLGTPEDFGVGVVKLTQ